MSTKLSDTKGHLTPNRAILLAAAVFLAIAGSLIYFRLSSPQLPKWIPWAQKSIQPTAEPDAPEAIMLANRRLTVQSGGRMAWQSPQDILVQDFLWCDINHDSENELILLCWRIGRYGQARPYWVKKDEKDWSQHIYIYSWENEAIRPLWMASDIGMDVHSFTFDEKQRLLITETNGRKTAWDWISWGLTLIQTYS